MTTKSSGRRAVLGAAFIIGGATSIQWSSAIVNPVLHILAPSAASSWRFLLGALILLIITRPALRSWSTEQWRSAAAYGAAVAVMNVCYFQALARIPLGTTVTIEFLGPLLVAVVGHRSWRHTSFAALAGIGVVCLGHPGGHLNAGGVLFALGAAAGWAMYLLAASRLGGAAEGFGGLAVSMSIAAVLTLPFAVGSLGRISHDTWLLGRMAIVASLSIVLGFMLEMQALRNVKPSLAGVMMAFDPAVATVLGAVLLHQHPGLFDLIGLACVIVAGIGVTADQREKEPSA